MTQTDFDGSISEELRARCVNSLRLRIGARLALTLDAEDLVGDSIVQVLARPGRGESEHADATMKRVRAVAELRIRGEARRTRREIPIAELETPRPANHHEEGVSGREDVRLLRHALAALPPEHQAILMLRDWLGAPWETVAFLLGGRSENAAQSLHQRALRALASGLG